MNNRRKFIKTSCIAGISLSSGIPMAFYQTGKRKNAKIKLGIIGLDTSHSPAFTKYINDPENEKMEDIEVVAAFPHGSRIIEASYSRIPEYTEQVKSMGVDIANSIDALLERVDGILLETNDGTVHYEQALPVFRAGIPVFVDKPVAADLVDVIRIYDAAREHDVPVFSSSSLRYMEKAQKVRHEEVVGDIIGADTFSPEKWEPLHSNLFWYGIHGVEILYTIMNTGCRRVKRILTDNTDLVIGEWTGERLGTFRGDLHGRQQYGGTAFGTKGVAHLGSFDGYGALLDVVADFFRNGKPPVDPQETIELYTFMRAAEISSQNNSDWVDLKEVYDKAAEEARM